MSDTGFEPPHPEMQRLAPLIGLWFQEGHSRDSFLGPGVPYTSKESFQWLEGGHFLVQTYETKFGDEATQKGICYWYYDAETATFQIIFFSNNGPYTEGGNRYHGTLGGGELTFTGPARFRHQLDGDGNIQVSDDGSIEAQWFLADEAGEYQPWMDARLRPASG